MPRSAGCAQAPRYREDAARSSAAPGSAWIERPGSANGARRYARPSTTSRRPTYDDNALPHHVAHRVHRSPDRDDCPRRASILDAPVRHRAVFRAGSRVPAAAWSGSTSRPGCSRVAADRGLADRARTGRAPGACIRGGVRWRDDRRRDGERAARGLAARARGTSIGPCDPGSYLYLTVEEVGR